MKWHNYALLGLFLFSVILTDQLSSKSWQSGNELRNPASIEAKDELEKKSPFLMGQLQELKVDELENTKWQRIKRIGIVPSQESNNLLESHLKFVSHMQAHRILEYFQYPADQARISGRKGIVRFIEFEVQANTIKFKYDEKGVSNDCIINEEKIMRCHYRRLHDDGSIAMDIYNYYRLES